jgi:hypothetical protein
MHNVPTLLLLALAVSAWSVNAHAHTEGTENPPDPQPRAADKPQHEATEDGDEDHRLLRIGALGGVGFPRPLELEAMIKLGDYVGLGAEYGVMPKVSIDGVDSKMWSFAGDLRVFPFRGVFFIGMRAGYQHIDSSTTLTVASLGSISESAEQGTTFINPRIGILWTTKSGLTIGVDAGVQVPLNSTFSSSLPSAVTESAPAAGVINAFGGVLPTVDLLQIGFMF